MVEPFTLPAGSSVDPLAIDLASKADFSRLPIQLGRVHTGLKCFSSARRNVTDHNEIHPDDGTAFVEDYLVDTDEAPDAYAMRINRTEDKVDELRGTVEDLEQTVEQQADEIETLREERENALDELREDLEDALNGQYRELLKEDIVAELRDGE